MGASVGRGGRRGFRDINVTPLVDVMLVLLVVFMVTAPLLTTGLKIELPNVQASNTPVKDGQLIVTITADGRVLFADTEVTGRVFQAFTENDRVQNERELYIRADENCRYGTVAQVVAAARKSGVESLNLLVEPEGGDDSEQAEAGKPK
jgi:biopolymer transport protein TolR